MNEVGDDVSLQQIEELDELAGLNDERPVECVVVDALEVRSLMHLYRD